MRAIQSVKTLLLLGGALGALPVGASLAQAAQADAEQTEGAEAAQQSEARISDGDIVVTARRRAESAQNVPSVYLVKIDGGKVVKQ